MSDAIERIRDGIEELRDAVRPRRSRGGLGFAAGVLVGVIGGIAGIALLVAAERKRRRSTGKDSENIDAELDEELAQTFPASDPLPQSHRVD